MELNLAGAAHDDHADFINTKEMPRLNNSGVYLLEIASAFYGIKKVKETEVECIKFEAAARPLNGGNPLAVGFRLDIDGRFGWQLKNLRIVTGVPEILKGTDIVSQTGEKFTKFNDFEGKALIITLERTESPTNGKVYFNARGFYSMRTRQSAYELENNLQPAAINKDLEKYRPEGNPPLPSRAQEQDPYSQPGKPAYGGQQGAYGAAPAPANSPYGQNPYNAQTQPPAGHGAASAAYQSANPYGVNPAPAAAPAAAPAPAGNWTAQTMPPANTAMNQPLPPGGDPIPF